MYRLFAAAAVLLAVCAVTAICFYTNTGTAEKIAKELEAAYSSCAKEGSLEEAEEHIKAARRLVIEKREVIYLFISHNKLDDISQEIDKAYECIKEKDRTLFLVYCRSAMSLTTDLREMELPELCNLL